MNDRPAPASLATGHGSGTRPMRRGSVMHGVLVRAAAAAGALAMLAASPVSHGASPVYKCEIDGQVTYQSSPCPSAQPRVQPTVQQLNAERQRRAQASAPAASVPAASPPAAPRKRP